MEYYQAKSYRARSSIGYLVRRAAALTREQLETALQRHEVTFVQWVTLILVRDGIATTPGDLCRELRHDSGALTRVLDTLEGRGFLTRERSDSDRRVIELRLTAAGRRTIDTLLPIGVKCLNGALEVFTRAEVETLTNLLQRFVARLEFTDAAMDAASESATKQA